MSVSITQESSQNRRLPINLDFMAPRYRTTDGYYTFTSPDLWTLEKNYFFLLHNSKTMDFNNKYVMRPDFLSNDQYGTTVLAQLLMYVNGVPCIEAFILNTVMIPSYSSIINILRDRFPLKSVDQLDEVDW